MLRHLKESYKNPSHWYAVWFYAKNVITKNMSNAWEKQACLIVIASVLTHTSKKSIIQKIILCHYPLIISNSKIPISLNHFEIWAKYLLWTVNETFFYSNFSTTFKFHITGVIWRNYCLSSVILLCLKDVVTLYTYVQAVVRSVNHVWIDVLNAEQ